MEKSKERKEKIISKSKSPKTIYTLGTSLQKNIGLDKQKFTAILNYNWDHSKSIKHSIDVLNAQFIKNLNPNQYFYVYSYDYGEIVSIKEDFFPDYPLTEDNAIEFINDEITPDFKLTNPDEYEIAKNVESRYYIITEDNFIPLLAYTFTYNNRESFKDNSFSFSSSFMGVKSFINSKAFKNKVYCPGGIVAENPNPVVIVNEKPLSVVWFDMTYKLTIGGKVTTELLVKLPTYS